MCVSGCVVGRWGREKVKRFLAEREKIGYVRACVCVSECVYADVHAHVYLCVCVCVCVCV